MVIQKLLRKLKSTPMDLRVLATLLPKYATTATYKQLKGKHRSQVFKNHKCIVLRIPKQLFENRSLCSPPETTQGNRIFFKSRGVSYFRTQATRSTQRGAHETAGLQLHLQLELLLCSCLLRFMTAAFTPSQELSCTN